MWACLGPMGEQEVTLFDIGGDIPVNTTEVDLAILNIFKLV